MLDKRHPALDCCEPIERVCTDRRVFSRFRWGRTTEVVEASDLIQINADTNGISNGLIDTCSRHGIGIDVRITRTIPQETTAPRVSP